MQLTVLQENLKSAVNLTSRFTSQKAQLPILGNILLKASKAKLTLSATNLETSVSISIGAKIEKGGEITVNGKLLNDIISNLTNDSIEIESVQENLRITSGKFKSNILAMNSADFPTLSESTNKKSFYLKTEEFVSSLSKVLFAVSSDETRPILTGVLFILSKGSLRLVATDGFRLSEVKLKGNIDASDMKIIIPKTVLYELTKISEPFEDVVLSYDKENNQIVFEAGEVVLSSRIIEGDFPDYEKIIPTASVCEFFIDKQELEKSIKLASVFARDSGKIIKLRVKKEELMITAESSASGNQEMNLEIRSENTEEDKDIDIMFNYAFVEDVLKVIEDDEVKIVIAPDNKASKFLDPKSSNFLHIIMPIKNS